MCLTQSLESESMNSFGAAVLCQKDKKERVKIDFGIISACFSDIVVARVPVD